MTAKDMRLTFRVHSDLKKRLESVAASEGRSVAQICEAFLEAGLMKYEKEGTRYVQRFLARKEKEP
jgi:predicted transcriptional regulator